MDANVNLNHNSADCIRSATHFGKTVYTNICNGMTSTVEWGGVDWAESLGLLGATAVFIGIFITFIVLMIRT